MTKEKPKLTPENIDAANMVLAEDRSVMLIPTKDRVRVVRIKHEEVKVNGRANNRRV